jgi:thioredoxin-dependent peroxiredoxin
MKISRISASVAAAFALCALSTFAASQLQVGDKAPLFSAHDQDGKKWSLKSFSGKEAVLLYFYPKDDTRGCTAEACSLRDKMSEFKQRDVQVVGVSFDNADSHQRFIFKYNLNFPLLVDSDGKITDLYGVRMDHKDMAGRVSFLIAPNGRIVHITDSPDPGVHLREMTVAVAHMEGKAP